MNIAIILIFWELTILRGRGCLAMKVKVWNIFYLTIFSKITKKFFLWEDDHF